MEDLDTDSRLQEQFARYDSMDDEMRRLYVRTLNQFRTMGLKPLNVTMKTEDSSMHMQAHNPKLFQTVKIKRKRHIKRDHKLIFGVKHDEK